ncbi:MAG: hypothetical protein JO251_14090, partial [Verrucomicrobia bacterium]|nr:hypothetical protein [Verrucomicrobiota bacterium]
MSLLRKPKSTARIQVLSKSGSIVLRLIELLREAKSRDCSLVVFPEMALTTFFPRWYIQDWNEVDHYFEAAMPGPETQPLFDEAARLGIGF